MKRGWQVKNKNKTQTKKTCMTPEEDRRLWWAVFFISPLAVTEEGRLAEELSAADV